MPPGIARFPMLRNAPTARPVRATAVKNNAKFWRFSCSVRPENAPTSQLVARSASIAAMNSDFQPRRRNQNQQKDGKQEVKSRRVQEDQITDGRDPGEIAGGHGKNRG